ncbi:phosphatase PAP2 family protein [Caballeronia sp. GAWG1-1]|uniref:phosphatase PAP2 family protein n=1 Tax=Caballeronia sp. GAWG1-1 TaxID=2921742 RepID=UPI002028EACB|nr:phosphatase PAP2 family protein [Caballeronia sp. GAWG1-1]
MDISQNAIISEHSKNPFRALTSYLAAWLVIGAIVLADLLWLRASGLRIAFGASSHALAAFSALVLVICWTSYRTRTVHAGNEAWIARLRDLAFTGRWMIALAAFCTAASVSSHLSAAVGAPLIDDRLVKIDQAVGFDWLTCYRWVRHHPVLLFVLSLAYSSGLVQMITVPVILGLTGRRVELIKHVARLMVATFTCLAIATAFPAASAFLHFHIMEPGTSETVSTFFPLREGALRTIDLTNPQGLVSMPSMHTAMAILFAYSLRRIPGFALASFVLNTFMIVSTPTQGGHYLCDIAGGIILALMVILLINDRRFEGFFNDR